MKAVVILLGLSAFSAFAADSGVLPFQSAGSLQRSADRRSLEASDAPATISGELLFPDGSGRFPAVILAHGCNDNRNVESAWGWLLRKWGGYATFNVDSFRGRGLNEVCTQSQVLVESSPDLVDALG